MAESPSVHKDRVLACSVYCNGSKLKDEYALVSAMVHQELNRIGKATLKFNAGNMDKQTFDESDADLFKPGNTIRLDAGDIDKEDTLFDGVIIGLRIITDRDFRPICWWNVVIMPIPRRKDVRIVFLRRRRTVTSLRKYCWLTVVWK